MMSTSDKVAGLVLAGGRSSRMGRDKALLERQGETLLERNCRLLKQAGCHDVFISGEYRDQTHSIRAIADTRADLGPVGGILSVMEQLQSQSLLQSEGQWQWLLIIAVDMPCLTSQSLSPLLDDLENAGPGRYVTNSHFPLLLRISNKHIEQIRTQLNGEGKRSRSLYRLMQDLNLGAWQIDAAHQRLVLNVNTPQQWRDCLATDNLQKDDTPSFSPTESCTAPGS